MTTLFTEKVRNPYYGSSDYPEAEKWIPLREVSKNKDNITSIKYLDAEGNPLEVGNSRTPIYFKDGQPTPLEVQIAGDLPADASLTDTTYSTKDGLTVAPISNKIIRTDTAVNSNIQLEELLGSHEWKTTTGNILRYTLTIGNNNSISIELDSPFTVKDLLEINSSYSWNTLTFNNECQIIQPSYEIGINVIAPEHGGTGQTTLQDAANAFINSLPYKEDGSVGDNQTYIVTKYNAASDNGYVRRPLSVIWTWIETKIRSAFGFDNNNVLKTTKGGTGTGSKTIGVFAGGYSYELPGGSSEGDEETPVFRALTVADLPQEIYIGTGSPLRPNSTTIWISSFK